jgi:hypothetical protein
LPADLERVREQAAAAEIALNIGPADANGLPVKIDARLLDSASGSRFGLFVALYENGLTTRVGAGENNGRTLRHDFVVHAWSTPGNLPASGRLVTTRYFSLPAAARLENLGVAAFVQNLQSGEVIQAMVHGVCG